MIDEYTRECLAIDVGRQHPLGSRHRSAGEAGPESERRYFGAPCTLTTEFVCRAILRWLHAENIDTAVIDPGKPWQNGSNESFNGKFRDECLSMQWFKNRTDAKILIEEFRRHYNEVRPHSSLGQLTPAEFKQKLSTTNPERAVFQSN